MQEVGIARIGTCPTKVVKTFVPTDDFKAIGARKLLYFQNGEVVFPPCPNPKIDYFYRTYFGGVAHDGVTYCNCSPCLRLALRRLNAARQRKGAVGVKNDVELPCTVHHVHDDCYEKMLRANQASYLQSLQPFLRAYAARLLPKFVDYDGAFQELQDHYADPHPKKALRVISYLELMEGPIYARLYLRRVKYKMKREEIAKRGKYGRTIGDLGVAASLQGFRLTEYLKQAQAAINNDSEDFSVGGGHFRFVKTPDPAVMTEIFEKLMSPPGRFYYVYFSDDACYSVRTPTGVKMYNLDISSCDVSHTSALFEALHDITPAKAKKDMRVLIDQCALPIKIFCPENRRIHVTLKPRTPRLYSGSTLTTAINNLANLTICTSIARGDLPPALAAERAGYSITMEECVIPEDLQFLKNSPVRAEDGKWTPVMNLGVLLRTIGNSKGELPGIGDWRPRAAQFQAALYHSFMTHCDTPLFTGCRKKNPMPNDLFMNEAQKQNASFTHDDRECKVDTRELLKRYRLTQLETEQLLELTNLEIGQQINGSAFTKILAKDYSLKCNFSAVEPEVVYSAS